MTSGTTRLKAPQVNDSRNLTEPHGSRHRYGDTLSTLLKKSIVYIYSISGKVVFVKMSDLVIIHGIYLRFLENPTFLYFQPTLI